MKKNVFINVMIILFILVLTSCSKKSQDTNATDLNTNNNSIQLLSNEASEVVSEQDSVELEANEVQQYTYESIEPSYVYDENMSFPTYAQGNGEVLKTWEDNGASYVLRKHIQSFTYYEGSSLYLYSNYKAENEITKLCDLDVINIFEILNIKTADSEENWLHVTVNNETGWIYFSTYDPYTDNEWIIQDIIIIAESKFTVRKYSASLCIWGETKLYSKIQGNEDDVVYTINEGTENSEQDKIKILAMTEEYDILHGETDHWLYVKYGDVKGWLFGSFASAERGGSKYENPEDYIKETLSYSNGV